MDVVKQVDARGLSCPMPIVRARKAIETIQVGDVMEVLVTDRGAPADFRNWCLRTDQKFLGLVREDGFFRILIKKVAPDTSEKGCTYPHEMTNAELEASLGSGLIVIDVREEPEYREGHVPGAVLVPIEEIESVWGRWDPDAPIAVICRSARRSDYACQVLARLGYRNVKNVVPGMSEWTGPMEKER